MFRGELQKLAPSRFLENLPPDAIEDYERPEEVSLDFNEVAELGRDFLARLTNKPGAPRS
jgi:hypothetical protein